MTKLVNSILEEKEDFKEYVKGVSEKILIELDEEDEKLIEELVKLFEKEDDFDILMENIASVPRRRINKIADKISDSKYLAVQGMTKGARELARFLNKHKGKIAVTGLGAVGAVQAANLIAGNPLPTAIVGGMASLSAYRKIRQSHGRK